MIRDFLLSKLERYSSKWIVLLIDLLLVVLTFVFAYFIRFDATFDFDKFILIYQIPFITLAALSSFLIVGSYKGVIRHTGTRDAFNVFAGTLLMSSIALIATLLLRAFGVFDKYNIPISIIIIHYFVNTFSLIISRFLFKAFYEVISSRLKEQVNVLIYGAGDSGLITYGAIRRDGQNHYNIIGFIDDDLKKTGKKIDQVKIFHNKDLTPSFLEKNSIKEVIISIQNILSSRLLEITDGLINMQLKVKIVPSLDKWIGGDLQASQIRQVKIEDLLDRVPINIINPIIGREVNNKVVLITGAAGSIGSEISRQISGYRYKQLILLDQAESALYDLQQELLSEGKKNVISIVADVSDSDRIDEVFEIYKPHKVFHAAAYKHVPLMEDNPYEAIKTNVEGTKIISDLSVKYKVDRFVMISTDKAVNPTNIMGATKRIAELYVSCLSKETKKTKFTTTRFGNVLGSNGSVIPLFRKQLLKGNALTVTDKEITRYFMTIPEACNLVLEAGSMGKGGEIYIFDMGKPVKIFEIAKKMIQLSGFKYPSEIDIQITGLRPGEKLHEELLANGENTTPTYHEKIMIAKTKEIDCRNVKTSIEKLCFENSCNGNHNNVLLMKQIVPEFISNNSIYEKLDKKVSLD